MCDFFGEKSGIAMKRIVVAAVCLSVLALAAPSSTANAADLPVKAPSYVAPAPVGYWDGLFVEGNLGWVGAKDSWCTDAFVTNCQGTGPHDTVSQSYSGVVGGGGMAYRFQYGAFVFGPEFELDAMSIHQQSADPLFPTNTRTETLRGLMNVTGDAGVAFDRFLAYGKGGWALTDLLLDANSPGGGFDLKGSEYVQGWTAGGGLEYMLPSGFSLGLEYDYYRFRPGNMINMTNTAGVGVPCGFCNMGNLNVQTVLARLTVRIGAMPTGH
jgi:outer membrane immunogenic protein